MVAAAVALARLGRSARVSAGLVRRPASGLRFDLGALGDAGTLALVPVLLAALPVVRGLPARLLRPLVGRRRAAAAALLQATSLPFLVAATQIGLEIGVVEPDPAAALVAAGLVSVLLFPLAAATLLAGAAAGAPSGAPAPSAQASPTPSS